MKTAHIKNRESDRELSGIDVRLDRLCNQRPSVCSLLALGQLILTACVGTSHHFLPPLPLESNETTLSVNWHYDFNGLNTPDLMPAWNIYSGFGDNINLGIGIQLFGITHLTAAKYYNRDESTWWLAYAHLNQPVGTFYNNHYLEIGGGLTTRNSGSSTTLLMGLSYGHGMSYGLAAVTPREVGERSVMRKFTHIKRILPFARLSVIGRDYGFSVNYSYLQSKAVIDNVTNAISYYNDTILNIAADRIDSIGWLMEAPLTLDTWGSFFIFLDDDTLWISGGGFDEYVNTDYLTTWSPLTWNTRGLSVYYLDGEPFLGSLREIENNWKSGKDLVITRFPEDVSGVFSRRNVLFRDLSIAFGFMNIHE